jgi:predicted ATPase
MSSTKIDKIRIQNFKCFRNQPFDFGQFTLLTGLNGSGKSTATQPLLLLRQSQRQGVLTSGQLVINGELIHLGTGRDLMSESADSDEICMGISGTDGARLDWSFHYDHVADVLRTGEDSQPIFPMVERPPLGGTCHYLSSDRIGPRASYPMSEYHVFRLNELGPRGEYTAHFLAEHGREAIPIPSLAHQESQSDLLIHQVGAWLGIVCQGVRLNVEPLLNMDLVRLGFTFEGQHGPSNEYRPTSVGFGLTYVLPILTATLAAPPGSLLIIENPEGHLHPRGQLEFTLLLARAAAAGVQVILETHSDHVLNGLRLAVHDHLLDPNDVRIHYFEREHLAETATVVSPVIDRHGRMDQWPVGFFDEWENALDRLMDD